MRIVDIISTAFRNLRHARMRTFLCVLAIAIGICSVCVIRGFGSCATRAVSSELSAIGIRGTTFYTKDNTGFDAEAISALAGLTGVSSVSRLNMRTGYIQVRTLEYNAALCGVEDTISDVFHLDLLYGRALNHADVVNAKRVLVLDAGTAKEAYNRENIIGKSVTVTIGGASDVFTVVGIIASQKGGLEGIIGSTLPCIAYLPYTTLNEMKAVKNGMLAVQFQDGGTEKQQTLVQGFLQHASGSEVEYQDLDAYGDSFVAISKIVALFAAGVAGISAVVAGIGVMNTMLSAVDSRTYEIGVYMALGAKKKDLVRSFFAETCLICLAGGIIGCSIYAAVFWGLKQLLGEVVIIEAAQIILGVCAALCCGVLFGIAPAWKASGKKPIDSLNEQK